jgi:EmrB/QacA subfamily drug resistance transporter
LCFRAKPPAAYSSSHAPDEDYAYRAFVLEAATPHPPATPCPRPASDPRWSLWVAILGSTMAFLDGTVVNVALPVMQRGLGANVSQMQWVVEGYALLLAAFVLIGGALGDRFGRRRIFVAGVLLFSASSGVCAIAPTASLLIVARVVQGGGAALLVPGSLALIGAAYRGEARGAAIGTWSSSTSVATAVGPLLGGWLVVHLSWRWLFLINVPIGILVAVMATKRVADTRDTEAPVGLDLLGALLTVTGLGAVTWALLEAPAAGGLGAPRILMALLFGGLTLSAFPWVEQRVRAPMVPLALFRSKTFSGANLATLFLYAALSVCLFFLPFDLIQVEGYSPEIAAAALLPFVVMIATLSRWSGAYVARRGARLPLVIGPSFAALGFILLATVPPGGSYWSTFFPGIAVLGLALGITVAPLTTAVMGSVEEGHSGIASGINNAVARIAGLLAIAALGVVLVSRFNRALDDELGRLTLADGTRAFLQLERSKLAAATIPLDLDSTTRNAIQNAIHEAFRAGFRMLMWISAALAALAALASLALVGNEPRPRVTE